MATEIRINLVTAIQHDPDDDVYEVTTVPSGDLWLDAEDLDQDLFVILGEALAEKSVLVIAFDPETGEIENAYPPITDVILTLFEPEDDKEIVRVHAMKRPSLCLLRKDHPRFAELYGLLRQAHEGREEGKVAILAVPPGDEDIHDVLLEPPVPPAEEPEEGEEPDAQ